MEQLVSQLEVEDGKLVINFFERIYNPIFDQWGGVASEDGFTIPTYFFLLLKSLKIRKLEMWNSLDDMDGMKIFLSDNLMLEKLHLSLPGNYSIEYFHSLSTGLQRCPNLHRLHLDSLEDDGPDAERLNLIFLSLRFHNSISELYLKGFQITKVSLSNFKELLLSDKLTKLGLPQCGIDDEIINMMILVFEHISNLKFLNLYSPVTWRDGIFNSLVNSIMYNLDLKDLKLDADHRIDIDLLIELIMKTNLHSFSINCATLELEGLKRFLSIAGKKLRSLELPSSGYMYNSKIRTVINQFLINESELRSLTLIEENDSKFKDDHLSLGMEMNGYLLDFSVSDGYGNYNHYDNKFLERNRNLFEFVNYMSMLLIAIRKFRRSALNLLQKDIVKLIALEIWRSRGKIDIWEKALICGKRLRN